MDASAFSLVDKTALITGAGQGIGRALAIGLAKAGARIVVTDVNPDSAAKVATEVQTLGPAAGVRERSRHSLAMTVAEWDHIIAVNLRGPFLLCQAVGRRMAQRGGGNIVNIASQLGLVGMAARPAYTASKAGLINLTRTLALEWAKQGIRVNAVAPGPILTPFTAPLHQDPVINQRYQQATPLGAWPEPEVIAGAVVYLASAASGFVTGSVLVVDGGYTAL